MKRFRPYVILVAVLALVAIAAGAVMWLRWRSIRRSLRGYPEGYPMTACPYHFEYGDFDKDGRTDVMTFGFMNMAAGNPYVYFGPLTKVRGWRRLHPFSRYLRNVGVGADLHQIGQWPLVMTTDYNNDGLTDFGASYFVFDMMTWMRNVDGRTFEQDDTPVVPEDLVKEIGDEWIRRIRFPDLNGDGAVDLFAQFEGDTGVIALGAKAGGFTGERVVFDCAKQEIWCYPDRPSKDKPVFYILGVGRKGAEPIIDPRLSKFLKKLDILIEVGIIAPEPDDPGPSGWFHDIESHWVLGEKGDVRLWVIVVIPTWDSRGWKPSRAEPRFFALKPPADEVLSRLLGSRLWSLLDSRHLPIKSYVWDTGDFHKYTFTNYDRFSILYIGKTRSPALLTPSGYAYWISTNDRPAVKFWKRFVFPKGRGKSGHGRAVVADVTDDEHLDLICTYRPWKNVIKGPIH